ncbi:MAG: hypothetical protein HZC41_15805 [Chloroflexi bacterium]|nr:hypothetical protein [Chloroflexota bacterium]
MPHDIGAIKSTFIRLLNDDAKTAIIDLLVPLLDAETPVSADDRGWAFWNVCDQYAMLRNAKDQYTYQAEFYKWSQRDLPLLRRHWVVSDGTQAMTLINGGFLEFWWDCYQSANESAPQVAENRAARFESHRANAAAYTHFREFSRAETALRSLEALLSEDPLWVNRDFATATVSTLRVEYYAALGQYEQVAMESEALDRYLDDWLGRLQRPLVKTFRQSLLGSWEMLNATRPPEAIFIAIHNAACALVIGRQFVEAERLFRLVLDEQREGMTAYSTALYLLACWHNRHSKDEIRDLLSSFQNVTLRDVLKFAPELAEALSE